MYEVCSALRLPVFTALNFYEIRANQEVAIASLTRYLGPPSTVFFYSSCMFYWLHGSPPHAARQTPCSWNRRLSNARASASPSYSEPQPDVTMHPLSTVSPIEFKNPLYR
jgi:hypothetical protein